MTAKRITSKENPIIKQLRQLEARKYRDRMGVFILEGPTVIAEGFEENIEFSFGIYSDSFEESDMSADLIGELEERGVRLYVTEDHLFRQISGTQTPRGILAVVKKPDWDEAILEEPGANFVVLDRVADPGNIGTMIRTSEAAGFRGIVVVKGSADIYSGKVSRAAAGALMRMPVFYVDTPEELVERMHRSGKRLICTDPRSDSCYYEANLAEDAAVVIGNEASGISDEIFSVADERVGIPMEGKTESLNAAVAACILMYESLRQKKMR